MQPVVIERYFNNQCTAEEAATVLKWFDTIEGQEFLKQRLGQDFSSKWSVYADASLDTESLLAQLQQRIKEEESEQLTIVHSGWQWLRWAAAAVVVLSLAGMYWYQLPKKQHTETAFGETRKVILSDQSEVTLNGNSQLSFKDHWGNDQTREVWVEGEAFFKVAHTASHQRFVVHLPNNVNVEVLGTEFNVYSRKAKTRVVLNTGKIRLTVQEDNDNALVMKPGDLFESDIDSKRRLVQRVNTDAYSSWRNSVMTFDNTSLAEIVQKLEETYGLEVTVADPALLEQRFSGTIPTKNIETLLVGLERLFDLKITKVQDKITIQSIY